MTTKLTALEKKLLKEPPREDWMVELWVLAPTPARAEVSAFLDGLIRQRISLLPPADAKLDIGALRPEEFAAPEPFGGRVSVVGCRMMGEDINEWFGKASGSWGLALKQHHPNALVVSFLRKHRYFPSGIDVQVETHALLPSSYPGARVQVSQLTMDDLRPHGVSCGTWSKDWLKPSVIQASCNALGEGTGAPKEAWQWAVRWAREEALEASLPVTLPSTSKPRM